MHDTQGTMVTHYRSGTRAGSPFEKPVILTMTDERDVTRHAWADARFATDILAEHGLFFALLMPEELASKERKEALRFHRSFSNLHAKIDQTGHLDVQGLGKIIGEMKRFIEYKHEQHEAQVKGNLRSLVWPLFFDHTRHEAERWVRRLEQLSRGEATYERKEVVSFWSEIMEEHARFVAHLLDPDEFKLIQEATNASGVFRELEKGGIGGVLGAAVKEPGTVAKSLVQNPDVDAVMSAAETILDFKTRAARDIEKAKIKSIIDPRLADHVRREALKFIDELKRAE